MTGRRIAVVGGGLVGCAAALMAQRTGAQVWLFEPAAIPAPSVPAADLQSWPIRHIAISPASLALLTSLGVDPQFPHGVFTHMQVWEHWGTAELHFSADDVGQPELGRMAEMPGLVAALWQRVQQVPAITVVSGQAVERLQRSGADSNTWTLEYGDAELNVDLVLAADGARSAVRESLRVAMSRQATGHHALATVVQCERPHGQVARQRFLLDGPLALLPSRDPQIVSIVWSQPPASAQRRVTCTDTDFCTDLSIASEGVLGDVQAVGQRAVFPIQQQLAAGFVPAPGVVLLGDAARVLHPLAGLGVNLGLEDVATLEPVLSTTKEGTWAAWARQRRARSLLMQQALRALQRTYGNPKPLMALLRNTGVRWLDRSNVGRRLLVREALGL